MRVRLVCGSELLFALELPAVLVVAAVVQELTRVAEPAVARLLVVLADVGRVVPSDSNKANLCAEKRKFPSLCS